VGEEQQQQQDFLVVAVAVAEIGRWRRKDLVLFQYSRKLHQTM